MDRRKWLSLVGTSTMGTLAMSGGGASAQISTPKLDTVHKNCLEACSDCGKACDMAYHHCLMQVAGGKTEHAKPLQYFADCSGFCGLSACNIAKHSPLMAYSCSACADACKATLAVVSKFDSEEMKVASKALTRCETSCRAMLEAMGHHAQ